jgi:hypothetical protein
LFGIVSEWSKGANSAAKKRELIRGYRAFFKRFEKCVRRCVVICIASSTMKNACTRVVRTEICLDLKSTNRPHAQISLVGNHKADVCMFTKKNIVIVVALIAVGMLKLSNALAGRTFATARFLLGEEQTNERAISAQTASFPHHRDRQSIAFGSLRSASIRESRALTSSLP